MIYILDDEPSVCESTRFLLESCGFEVRDFTAASRFLEQVGDTADSCLLLDLSMPGMHGFQVKKELVSRNLPLPVIYTTAYCDTESVRRIEEEGDCILLKPYTAENLLDCIRRYIPERV